MFNVNPKTNNQNCLTFCSCYEFFYDKVSDFKTYFTAKIQNYNPSYIFKKLSYINIF